MTHSNSDAENAFLAVDAMRNPTRGAAPDWTELQAFRDGDLSSARREQVLSHIANDAEVYQQWLDLAEAEQWLANPANESVAATATAGSETLTWRQRLTEWFTPTRSVFAGAAAMAVAAVAVVPMLVQQVALNAHDQFGVSAERYAALALSTPSAAPRVRKTRDLGIGQLTNPAVEKLYVQAGLRSVVEDTVQADSSEWSIWLDRTPGEGPDCANVADEAYCGAIADDAELLGQWTMLTWFGCRQQNAIPATDEFWGSQTELWNTLRVDNAFAPDSKFAGLLTPLDGTGTIELCDRSERLMAEARSSN